MRDAQSNFDQVISFSGDKIESKDVIVALGLAGAEMLVKTAKAIAENKPAEVLHVVDDLIGRGQDLRNFCRDLLSFFRDLLIYKMAGEAENLLDTAVLSRDELRDSSAPFSENDLIRFFNSLSDTESKLREATQPRYVLEIGLVKLVEMRRVVSMEKILERLARLENALANGNTPNEIPNQSKAVAPTPEKKTLTVDFSLEEVPFPVSDDAISDDITVKAEDFTGSGDEIEISRTTEISASEEKLFAPVEQIELETEPVPTLTFAERAAEIIEAMPIKMLPISSEELEHIEDTWLDDAYERRLQELGDDLKPIHNASNIVEILLAENQENNLTAKIETSHGTVTAAAPAKIKSSFVMPDFGENESDEIPILPENPTEEQMWEYANNHPLVKKALRIFRGKLIEVRKV